MPRRLAVFFILALVFPGLFFTRAFSSQVAAETDISEAVVYRGRARVVREGRAKIGPGEHTVRIPGLTSRLEPESLRLSGEASGEVKIISLEAKRVHLSEADDPEIVRLKAEIEKLSRKGLEDAQRIEVLSAHEKFLDSIARELSRQAADSTRRGSLEPQGVKTMAGYLMEERRDAGLEKIGIEERIEERKKEIRALKKRLEELRSRLSRMKYDILVSVSCQEEAEFRFTLSYLAGGANWRPAYILRKEKAGVKLEYYGEVTQMTGENWRDVRLSLSTARPALGARPPELPPWYLDIPEPRDYLMSRKAARAEAAAPAVLKEAEEAVAAPEPTGTTTLFRVPGRQSLESRKGRRRFMVAGLDLRAEFTWLIRPEMREFAYLTAKVKNSSDHPILRGPAEAFVGPDFVGKALLGDAARGEELEVGFGVDEGVRVKRELVKDFRSEEFFGGRVKRALAVEIGIENLKHDAIEARVEERLPVSRNEKIEVELSRAEPEPEVDEKKGRIAWPLTLEAGAKEKVAFEVTITYPKDAPVSGI